MINIISSTKKKRNRGHLIQDTGDASQPGGPSEEGPADFPMVFPMSVVGKLGPNMGSENPILASQQPTDGFGCCKAQVVLPEAMLGPSFPTTHL